MADDSSPPNVDPGLVAEIVRSYVANNSIAIDQIGGLIASVHRTLYDLGNSNSTAASSPLVPAVPIRRSVQPDHVVCLECGFRGKILRRHLRLAHGLDPAAYRSRWELPSDHPLIAPDYAAHRSVLAKQLGLGRARQDGDAPPRSTAAPRRRGRPPRAPIS